LSPAGARILAVLVAPAAVLVAAILLLLRLHFQPARVPPYSLVTDGGQGLSPVLLRPGSRFELEATPAIEAQGALTARAFLVRSPAASSGTDAGEEVRPWRVPMEIGRDGSVHVAGPVDALFAGVPPGEWEVVLAVGRPEMLPNNPRELLEYGGPDGGAAAWRVIRERVRLGP
jgi:hypothetical protein